MEEITLTALVAGVESGDAFSEAAFVRRFSKGVRVFLSRICSDAGLVEDLSQETLTLVLLKLRERAVEQPESLHSFVRSTARNLLIANRRYEKRYLNKDEASLERVANEHQGATHGSPLDTILEHERSRIVGAVLSELTQQRDRQILCRYYLAEESSAEVCRALDIEPKLFNRVLFRARARAKELLLESRSGREARS